MTPNSTNSAATDKPAAAPILGFLTILQDASGYVGGYLVTNLWDRPLEFRLTSAVQPNRVQQILYGRTLLPYLSVDLLGRALVDRTGIPVNLIFTDREMVLDLRPRLDIPIVHVAAPADPLAAQPSGEYVISPATASRGPVTCHPCFPADAPAVRELIERVEGSVDLAEPFARIREAAGEARKMGVTRAA